MPHWHDIRHNAYTENPGSDWIALDGVLTPIGRASTEEALRRASPDGALRRSGTSRGSGLGR